jgi:hypothetical protein
VLVAQAPLEVVELIEIAIADADHTALTVMIDAAWTSKTTRMTAADIRCASGRRSKAACSCCHSKDNEIHRDVDRSSV